MQFAVQSREASGAHALIAPLIGIVNALASVLARRPLTLVLIETLDTLRVKPVRATNGRRGVETQGIGWKE